MTQLGGSRRAPSFNKEHARAAARLALVLLAATGCSPALPEPESAGAVLYAGRCSTCHRLYAPGSMKFELWKQYVERMQGEMVRRGLPPLSDTERTTLLEYLKRHTG